MKNNKSLFSSLLLSAAALALGCTLTVTATASGGVMEIPPAPAPATAQESLSLQDTTAGELTQTDADDLAAEAALSFLRAVLSLF